MALTKHQKLARGLKALLDALDLHYQKTANLLDALQFHFYETHLIIGRNLMTEQALRAMMYTHLCSLQLFPQSKELRIAARSAPLIGFVITPKFYPISRTLVNPLDASNEDKQVVPWGVKIVLPSESLQKLSESMKEALLYCASEEEMSEWIDWFELEDIANTFTNQIATEVAQPDTISVLEKNLNQPVYSFFYETALEYQKEKNPTLKTFNAEFAPDQENTVEQAYEILSKFNQSKKESDFDDFKRFWRDQLEKRIFTGMSLSLVQKQTILEERFSLKGQTKHPSPNPRWKTSHSVDRQTYGSFIRHFAERFLRDPQKHQTDGEIVVLLWVMIYVALDPHHRIPLKRLLALTTAAVRDQAVNISNHEVEISIGLANLLKEYTGGVKPDRQRKLFPNLSSDKLEDYFRRASSHLLPPGSLPALPEAFLTFPHADKQARMLAKVRQHQLKHPPKVHHNLISRQELKRQLIEKSKPRIP